MRTNDGETYVGPSDTTVMLGESAKTGFRLASIGTLVGAAVGVAVAAFLKLPKGQTIKVVEGLETGAKTAGAIMGGTVGMVTGGLVGNTYGLMKGAEAVSQNKQHVKDPREALAGATDGHTGSMASFVEKLSAERETKPQIDKNSGRSA